jgi:hypothetical protein
MFSKWFTFEPPAHILDPEDCLDGSDLKDWTDGFADAISKGKAKAGMGNEYERGFRDGSEFLKGR